MKQIVDGWRGKINSEFNPKNIAKVAQAVATRLKQINPGKDKFGVAIGYDGRKNSKEAALLFARVASGNSINVFLADKPGATPILSNYIRQNNLDGGVMITGSSAPADYNGIKLKGPSGSAYTLTSQDEIQNLIGFELIQADDELIMQSDLRSNYFEKIQKEIDFELISNSGIRILFDSMSGSGQQILESILRNNGISSRTIFKIAEENLSDRIPDPVESNLKPLIKELNSGDYSLGIATDGDCDRIGVVMDNGEYLSSQEVILLLVDYLFNIKNETSGVVKTASVTNKLKLAIKSEEIKIKEVPVGFQFVSETLLKEDFGFGFEDTGGFAFAYHLPERDGIFSALLFIEMLAQSGYKKLSELVNLKRKIFGKICFTKISLDNSSDQLDTKYAELVNFSANSIFNFSVSEKLIFTKQDGTFIGVKFYLGSENRWMVFRKSESEEKLRIYIEADNDEELSAIVSDIYNYFNKKS